MNNEPNRQVDALVAERIMGLTVVMRWCIYDGEDGGVDRWREDQEWREIKLAEARSEDRAWYSDTRIWQQLPCICKQQVGAYQEWRTVEPYSSDHNAAAQMRAKLYEMWGGERFVEMLYDSVAGLLLHSDGTVNYNTVFEFINATPLQQCAAALRAVGVDVEVTA